MVHSIGLGDDLLSNSKEQMVAYDVNLRETKHLGRAYSLSIFSQDAVSCTRESQYLTILCEEASRADRLGSKGGFLSSVQIHIKTKKDSGQQEVLILSRYK